MPRSASKVVLENSESRIGEFASFRFSVDFEPWEVRRLVPIPHRQMLDESGRLTVLTTHCTVWY